MWGDPWMVRSWSKVFGDGHIFGDGSAPSKNTPGGSAYAIIRRAGACYAV